MEGVQINVICISLRGRRRLVFLLVFIDRASG